MRIPRFRTRLAGQLLALLVPWSCFVLACLLLAFSGRAERFQRDRDLQATRVLAAEVAPLSVKGDLEGVERRYRRHADAQPALRYLLVLEPSGDLRWSSFAGGAPRSLVELDRSPPRSPEPTRVSVDGELIDDYRTLRSGFVLRVGYSVQPARDLAMSMLPVLIGTGLVGLALVFVLASYLSRPIEALSQAVVGGAGAPTLPELAAVSETSEIAHAFGEVIGSLEEREQQLEAARRLAPLGELSAPIAPDVNNPRGVVVLNAELLARRVDAGQLPENSHREVRRLWVAARRATMMVQRFLQIARWSNRPSRVAQRFVDIPALVAETVELLEERARKAGVTVQATVADDMDLVWCDEQGLMQVVMNLVSNAIEASPRGEVVTISMRVDDEALVLSVADHGPGMPEATAERATEPFFTTKPKGSGLGLAICDQVIKAHDGQLVVETEAGRGTTFTVVVPQTGEMT